MRDEEVEILTDLGVRGEQAFRSGNGGVVGSDAVDEGLQAGFDARVGELEVGEHHSFDLRVGSFARESEVVVSPFASGAQALDLCASLKCQWIQDGMWNLEC
jgi:hypothetical protein